MTGAVLALSMVACEAKVPDMIDPAGRDDHGLGELSDAARELAKDPTSPAAYRTFALQVEAVRPQFTQDVAEQAELQLAYLAFAPLEAQLGRPLEEQLENLALTLYPTAFEVKPRDGESPREFITRMCRDAIPLECRQYVPQAWPRVFHAKVWRAFKNKAQQSLRACRLCAEDAPYEVVLDRYNEISAEIDGELALDEADTKPSAWPVAGAHAEPWPEDITLFQITGRGDARLDGTSVESGAWAEALVASRSGGGEALGAHLRGGTKVQTLRSIAADAAAAGYTELVIQARVREFPYERRGYRVRIGPRARGATARTRDIDTIQILVRVLDHGNSRGEPTPRL